MGTMTPAPFITFDCYGTLIDWESGIASAFQSLPRSSPAPMREAILRAYAAIEPEVQRNSYRSYREVLADSGLRVAKELGLEVPHSAHSFLAESLPSWQPFPDTNTALESLRASGYQLGILSNIDDDLLAATRRHFTVPFDLIITAQQVHSYKPAPAHFLTARTAIGNADWTHAAQSNFHDIVPTNLLGIRNAWINRKGERPSPGGDPTEEFADMQKFAEVFSFRRP